MADKETLRAMHQTLLEALRSREQEVFQYLSLLFIPLGGFGWLLIGNKYEQLFYPICLGAQLMMFLGVCYTLALGYNYRYVVFQLAKIEAKLGIKNAILCGWPRDIESFKKRYGHYCTPPAIIKVFWIAFVIGLLWVSIVACLLKPNSWTYHLVFHFGILLSLGGVILPWYYGKKMNKMIQKEQESPDPQDKWQPYDNRENA